MAAEQMRHRVSAERLDDWAIDSAGTLGIEGAPASPEAVEAMREVGVDLRPHRSQGVLLEHVEWADLIVAMTHAHLMELASMFPRALTPRFVLRAFEAGPDPDRDAPDLADPIGKPLRFYRGQVPVIVRCVDHLIEHLRTRSP
jgi:protein-tyrosine phosphatase